MDDALISSPVGVLTILCGIGALFFLLEERTRWKLFSYFPPLIFIYAVPAVMSNTGILTKSSPVYDWLSSTVLPLFLVIMLLKVDFASTVRITGKGIFVMLFGTAGVVLGAPIAFLLVRSRLPDDAEVFSVKLPELGPVLTASTWKILLITTMGLLLSLTPARRIPASHELAMALVYIFVANMGAKADVSGLAGTAGWFILACYLWIAVHGAFCVLGAYLMSIRPRSPVRRSWPLITTKSLCR